MYNTQMEILHNVFTHDRPTLTAVQRHSFMGLKSVKKHSL
jgi:hypothetical protein